MDLISYSNVIGTGEYDIYTEDQFRERADHNTRTGKEDKDISVLVGASTTEQMVTDLRHLINSMTDSARIEYNSHQSRNDRKIQDYYEKICGDKKTRIAVEIIIEIGDYNFWKKIPRSEWKVMDKIYETQLDRLKEFFPGLIVISQTCHYDEKTGPHSQILATAFSDDYKTGLKTRVCISRILTDEKMDQYQDYMRQGLMEILIDMAPNLFGSAVLIPKAEGRGNNLKIRAFYERERELDSLKHGLLEAIAIAESKEIEYQTKNDELCRREERVSAREMAAQEREDELREEAELLHTRELTVEQSEADIDTREKQLRADRVQLDNDQRRTRHSDRMMSIWLRQLFDAIRRRLMDLRLKRFKGKYQMKAMEILGKIKPDQKIIEELETAGIHAKKGDTLDEIYAISETKDIKALLKEEGIKYSDIDAIDVVHVREKFDSEYTIEEAVMAVAEEIRDKSRDD